MTGTQKTTAQIEAEIEIERQQMADDLHRLDEKMAVGDITRRVLDFAENDGRDIVGALSRGARDNPVPLALIGLGALWLFQGDRARGVTERAREKAGAARDRVSDASARGGERLRDGVSNAGARIRDGASAARARTGEFGRQASRNVADYADRNPLVMVAAAFAVGGLLGAATPNTRRENELMGDHAQKTRDRAREAFDETRAQADQFAHETRFEKNTASNGATMN